MACRLEVAWSELGGRATHGLTNSIRATSAQDIFPPFLSSFSARLLHLVPKHIYFTALAYILPRALVVVNDQLNIIISCARYRLQSTRIDSTVMMPVRPLCNSRVAPAFYCLRIHPLVNANLWYRAHDTRLPFPVNSFLFFFLLNYLQGRPSRCIDTCWHYDDELGDKNDLVGIDFIEQIAD